MEGRALRSLKSLGLMGALLSVPSTASPQSISAGRISGVVVDAGGRTIADAIAWLRDRTTGVERFAESASDGRFVFSQLHPGSYDVRAEQLGYRPKHVRDIRLGPGAAVTISMVLEPTEPPVTVTDSVPFGGAPADAAPGVAHAFPYRVADRLPLVDRDLSALADLTARGAGLQLDGLGPSASAVAVDGTLHPMARHPYLPTDALDAMAFPRMAFHGASVLSSPVDLEWGGPIGDALSAYSRRGTREFSASLYADWAGTAGAGSDYFDPNAVGHSSFRGGALVSGPIIPDTAHFMIGAEAQRLQLPQAPAWIPTSLDSALLQVALDSFSVDLGPYAAPRAVERRLITAFGRFDWDFSQRHRASAWASFANAKDDEADRGPDGILGFQSGVEGTDVAATAAILSALSDNVGNEFRVGFETSSREYGATVYPGTRVGVSGQAFGTDPAQPGTFKRTGASVSNALHVQLGAVRVKLGLGAGLASHDQTYAFGGDASYWFSDPDAYGAGLGAYLRTNGSPPRSRFSSLRVTGLLQNTWTVSAGLDLRFGLRWDGEWLPADEVVRNDEWLTLTGLVNDSIDSFLSKFSPRFGFRWTLGSEAEWVVQGSGTVQRGEFDPALMGEVIREAGRTTVSRGIGDVGWRDGNGTDVSDVGARLSVLGPEFQDPRSSKLSLGIARKLGTDGLLEVSAHYRHTDFLARRHDLNRLPSTAGQDQHGRPLYGTLVKEGGVIAADPTSNRRFAGFELVSALDPDGYSDYWGVTARLEQPVGRFFRLLASYTYSQATDNVLTGRHGGPYAQLTPFPDSLSGADWADGRSDFDVPHRAAVGVELRPIGRDGFTLAALYRYRSGLPFTPGFPNGVDANGDGSASNDPAFVNDAFPGLSDLYAGWDCLRIRADQFAARNACRDPAVSTLDLRIGLGPFWLGGYPFELWTEVLNVTDAQLVSRDHALFLVDPAAALTTDPVSGQVAVPLLLNENFGEPLSYRGNGRAVRFGLRVNY
ncbi:MAG: TonB-dependent receptor [Gemmatimonadota bacterium]|nr:TonB-dependent receptor [Gemmatimonadota bacterium]MDH3367569.1 TonB-dependent receptor [Gemmatimonadota bacterium]MDH3569497.1 TonB-dependent receptor [Gemmatimonadota bacterium]MDH5550025.1 TonB-dependent receptor [Gemmatimonadota bacterium]